MPTTHIGILYQCASVHIVWRVCGALWYFRLLLLIGSGVFGVICQHGVYTLLFMKLYPANPQHI